MTNQRPSTPEQIDALLFGLLAKRGIANTWASTSQPREALAQECRTFMADKSFRDEMAAYLRANPVVAQSIETVLAQLAFSAGVRAKPENPLLQQLAQRGQNLSRWLPTFLLIDGPLGRLLRQRPSPMAVRLNSAIAQAPLLAGARDAFNNDLFRKVRNGFAHWSFTWHPNGSSATITIFHFESGAPEVVLSQLEAEALHYLSASVIQTLDEEILRKTESAVG